MANLNWQYINKYTFENGSWEVYFDSDTHTYKGKNEKTNYIIKGHDLSVLVKRMERYKD
jgi:hypothetical protein